MIHTSMNLSDTTAAGTTAEVDAAAALQSAGICTLNPLRDQRWARFVERHAKASIFHTSGWLKALHDTYGYAPFAATNALPGKQIQNAIVFCHVNSWVTGRRVVSLPFSDHCEPLVESDEELANWLRALQCDWTNRGYRYAEFRPMRTRRISAAGWGQSAAFVLHTVDLRPPISQVFQRFHKDSIQRKIRRAEREGLFCRSGKSEDLLRAFYPLLVHVRRRHDIPPQPYRWFRNLLESLRDSITIWIAYQKQVAVAGIVTFTHKSTLVYKYGGSDDSYHPLGAMPYLFWQAMQHAKAQGLTVMDLGRSDVTAEGLRRFKAHLGATETPLHYFHWPSSLGTGMRPHSLAIHRIGALLPGPCRRMAGRLLYRHFG